MIEISQLQTLVAVAHASSFSKAADELSVTQSAISQSIKNLEIKIGVKLFKRSGKRVVLTQEGEKLFNLGTTFLGQMDETLEEILNDKNTMSGKVRIGTLQGIGKSWLAPNLLKFAKLHTNLSVGISLGFQENLIRKFENYQLDILILPEDSLPSFGEKIFLSEEKATLVFPKSDDFNITQDITLEELSKLPTVLFERDDPLYLNWCLKKFGKIPKKINMRYAVNSHGNMLQAVLQGLGVAVIPTHVLRRSFYLDKLSEISKQFEVTNGKFYLVYHKDSKELLRIKTVIDHIVNADNPLSVGLVH
jgi:DNA-binding transcriptional LysR family regulator